MAEVVSINISKKKGTFKYPVSEANLITDFGIEGDAHTGKWHRQVSLLDQESIDKMVAMGVKDLTPGKFAENITTKNIHLYSLPIGTRLRIGGIELEVTQIGKECHQHCQIYHQVGVCVMPLEGIFTRVITGGIMKPGEKIEIFEPVNIPGVQMSENITGE
jgi:MOSC domain-containing protein YiiM